MSFFPACELGKELQGPLQLSALCSPSPPMILHSLCFLPTPGQRQPKEARVRQECCTATCPWDLLPLLHTHTHTHTHTQMRSFSLQECPQAMGGLLKVDQVRKDLRNWSDSSSLLPQPGYSCLCPNPPGTQGWLPCVTHMGASPIRLLPVFP